MDNPTDTSRKLAAFVKLLSICVGLDVTIRVNGSSSSEGPPRPVLVVALQGRDAPLELARNREIVDAVEHIAAKILGLERKDDDHDKP